MTSDTSYCELLHDLWPDGKTFVVVEHDIVITPDTIPESWPAPRLVRDGLSLPGGGQGLGPRLHQVLGLADRPVPGPHGRGGRMQDAKHPLGHWCRMDAWIWHALTKRGISRCEHQNGSAISGRSSLPRVLVMREGIRKVWESHDRPVGSLEIPGGESLDLGAIVADLDRVGEMQKNLKARGEISVAWLCAGIRSWGGSTTGASGRRRSSITSTAGTPRSATRWGRKTATPTGRSPSSHRTAT